MVGGLKHFYNRQTELEAQLYSLVKVRIREMFPVSGSLPLPEDDNSVSPLSALL